MSVVGAFEAKTKLSELLARVEQGEEIVITRRGKPVAKLVAPDAASGKEPRRATADELLRIGKEFQRLVQDDFASTDINDILYDADGLPK